nr:substrate-binding domain-containing protein [Candidatus Sigynarchaeota archaeon]
MEPSNVMKRLKARRQRQAGALLFFTCFIVGFIAGSLSSTKASEGEVLFTIAYSSEKEGWMEQIKQKFLDWYAAKYPDEHIKLNFFPVGSRDSIIAILNGQYKPAIWSPAASTWVPILNYLWQQQSPAGAPTLTTINATAIYSPIVVATWESIMAAYNLSSMWDMYNLTLASPSPIKLAHTDPRSSNSGFCAIIMEVAAAARKNSTDLTLNDLTNTTIQAWVKQFESVAVQYGTSTGYLVQSMLQSGPSGITSAFLYENLIIEKSGDAKAQWGDGIVAMYPAEGSVHSDHPFCVLDGAPWMANNQALMNVSTRFVNLFLMEQDILELATHHGFRVYNKTITLPVDVFSSANGVMYNISSIPKMDVPRATNFTNRVADFWLMNRPVF